MPKFFKSLRRRKRNKSLSRRLAELLIFVCLLWLIFGQTTKVLKKIAISQIGELTNTRIQAELVDIDLNGSIWIQGLQITPNQQTAYDNTFIKAKNLHANFSLASLVTLKPVLNRISISDFVLNIQHDTDNSRWNVTDMKISPPKAGAGKMPLIKLQNGQLQYTRVSNGKIKTVASMPLDINFQLNKKTNEGYSFEIITAKIEGSKEKSSLKGFWNPGNIFCTGTISSANIPSLEKAWMIQINAADLTYDKDFNYTFKFSAKDPIDMKSKDQTTLERSEFLESTGLLASVENFFYQFNPWGQINIDINANGNLNNFLQSKADANVTFLHKKESLKNHDNFKLVVSAHAENFGSDVKYEVHMKSDKIALSDKLYNSLPQQYKVMWDAFAPTGDIAFDYSIEKLPGSEKKNVTTIELLGTNAKFVKFQYPLNYLSGKLIFGPNYISACNIVSNSDGRKITANGKITDILTDHAKHDLLIEARDIPLDQTLKDSVTKSQKNLLDHFEISGLVDSDIHIFDDPCEGQPTFSADVFFKGASISPINSNLSITEISGKTVFTADRINIEKLQGQCLNGTVQLAGQIQPDSNDDHQYSVSVNTDKIQLSDNLFSVLPDSMKNVVSKFNPQGLVSYHINLNKTKKNKMPDYQLDVDCHDVSINYADFPYPLNNITGKISITKDNIKLHDIEASPAKSIQITENPSKINIDGTVNLKDDQQSMAQLKINAQNIPFDQNLELALPEKFKSDYRKLSPTGAFDINFDKLNIAKTDNGNETFDFSASANLNNCDMNSLSLTGINSGIKMSGLYKNDTGFENADIFLNAQSVNIKDKNLTNLKSEIYYDPNDNAWRTKNLFANCYDGKLTGRFGLKTQEACEYQLSVAFGDIDLKKFLHKTDDQNSLNGHSTGKIDGTLSLIGQIGFDNSHTGRCNFIVSNMKVGKLSPLAALVQVLKLKSPQQHAFNQMIVDFYIKKDVLFFSKFDLSGQEIALNGKGGLNLTSHDIKLILYARGNRSVNAEPSIVESVFEAIGRGVIQVSVSGKYEDPVIKTQPLPFFKNTLTLLGTEPLKPKTVSQKSTKD